MVCVLTYVLAAGMIGLFGAGPQTAAAADRGPDVDRSPKTALTEQAAQETAAESGQRVEVARLRDERSQTFANPDGTFTSREYVQSVRTWKDGSWTPISSMLTKQPNGRLTTRATSTAMTFSGGGDSTFATVERDGKTLSVAWPGKLPEPVVDGSTATYRGVLPDVDLVVHAENDGFSHLLVVKSAKAAANPGLASITMPLKAEGLEVKRDTDGGLVARDPASGGTVFEAPQPVMWDSTGLQQTHEAAALSNRGPAEGARIADVGLTFQHGAMTLTPDRELLTGEKTHYPVIIDPVTKTASRTGWTWVSSANPELEGWKFSNVEDDVEAGRGVGRCPADVSFRCTGSDDVQRQYYALPTGSLEGKTILKAEFAITLVHTYDSDAHAVQLHRVNSSGGSAINSKTNWSNKPSSKDNITSSSPTNPAGSCSTTNQNVRFGVTSTLQKAATSGWDTTTFGLQAASEDTYSSWKRFCNNAALEVTYNRPPYQPKMGELTMSPGGQVCLRRVDEALREQATQVDRGHLGP